MDYKNREQIEYIFNNIDYLKNIIEKAKYIQNNNNKEYNVELRINLLGSTETIPLNDEQIKYITNKIINDNNKKLNNYMQQLKQL